MLQRNILGGAAKVKLEYIYIYIGKEWITHPPLSHHPDTRLSVPPPVLPRACVPPLCRGDMTWGLTPPILLLLCWAGLPRPSSACGRGAIVFLNNEYTEILIAISEDVPENNRLLTRITKIFTEASALLYQATRCACVVLSLVSYVAISVNSIL